MFLLVEALTFPPIPRVHPRHAFSGRGGGAPGTGAVSPLGPPATPRPASGARPSPLGAPHRPFASVEVLIPGLRQKVGWHQPSQPIQLAYVEPVVIHIAVYVYDVARPEGQLYLQFFAFPTSASFSNNVISLLRTKTLQNV